MELRGGALSPMLRKRRKTAETQVPAVPASWTAGDLKKRSSGGTQVVPAMDMPLASCTGGDLTQPPSGAAQVVQAIGMQLGALAQATELLAEVAFASSATTRDILSVHDYSKKARKPHNKRKRRNRPRNRGSNIFQKIKKATMDAEAAMAVEAADHHMRRRDRRRKRGSGIFKKIKKATMVVEAAMVVVVQEQAATSEDESHHMRRRDRRRKRGSGKCKKAKKGAFAEAGEALTLIP